MVSLFKLESIVVTVLERDHTLIKHLALVLANYWSTAVPLNYKPSTWVWLHHVLCSTVWYRYLVVALWMDHKVVCLPLMSVLNRTTACIFDLAASMPFLHQEGFIAMMAWTLIGCTNQKIDILKLTCKLLLCVGVGLIKKTLEWQQISPSSENIIKYVKIELLVVAIFCNLANILTQVLRDFPLLLGSIGS